MSVELPIDSIVVGNRVRQSLGDIDSLAASIQRHGLLHPIVINDDKTLVAGFRRLEAVRSIGWKEIPVTILNIEDMLSAERDENAERKDFTPTEAVAIGRMIEERERPKAMERKRLGIIKSHLARSHSVGSVSEPTNFLRQKVDDIASRAVGMGHTKYRKAKEVVRAAEANPVQFGDLPGAMDESGNVGGAHQEMKRRKGAETNGRKPRHPVHRKTHYPKPNRTVERATWALAGICDSLETVDASELDAAKVAEWVKSLRASAAKINQITKRFTNA